jgi:hypothetical protein
MGKQTRSILKGYFETGDVPTEGQYVDLIDSNLNLSENNTGDILLTGNISASSNISASRFITDGEVTASGNISSSGNIFADTISGSILSASSTTHTDRLEYTFATGTNISASGNISGNILLADAGIAIGKGADISEKLEVIGNISASGTGSFVYTNTDYITSSRGSITMTSPLNIEHPISGTHFSASGRVVCQNLTLGGENITATGEEINYLDGLTGVEAASIKTIDTNDIKNVHWGYLQGMNQSVASGSSAKFAAVTVTDSVAGLTVEGNQPTFETAFGDGGVVEGRKFDIEISSIPNINPYTAGRLYRVMSGDMTNANMNAKDVIYCTTNTHLLAVDTYFTTNDTFQVSFTNYSTEEFTATSCSINCVLI